MFNIFLRKELFLILFNRFCFKKMFLVRNNKFKFNFLEKIYEGLFIVIDYIFGLNENLYYLFILIL